MKIKLFFVILLFVTNLKAQTSRETDSLLSIVRNSKSDSAKVSVLNKLALNFISSDVNKAKSFQNQSEQLAFSKNLKYGYNESIFVKGGIYVLTGNPDSAIVYYKKGYDLSLKNKFKPIEVRCLNGFGLINWNKGNFDTALNYFFKAIKLNESLPQKQRVNASLFYNNIGLIYVEKRLYDKALIYFQTAYEIRVKDKMLTEQGVSLNNLGICYNNLKKTDLAIAAFEKGKIITKQTNNTFIYYKIIHNLGNLYADNGAYKKAIELYLEILKKPNGVNENPRDLIILFGCISNTYSKMGLFDESIKYANLGLDVLKKHPELEKFADVLYNATSKYYFHAGNIQKGDYYLIKYYAIIKKLFSEESKLALAEMEVKYNSEKREKLLIKSKAVIEKRELELKNKNAQFAILSLFSVGLLVIIYLLYIQQKQKINQQKQEYKLKKAIAEIETQKKLQEQRLQISRDLHDNIGSNLTFIISSVDSIKYAFDLKNSKLDDKLNYISNFARLTITELRDTIWAMNKKEIVFEDLKTRVSTFIGNAKISSQGIKFQFEIHGDFKETVFTAVEGMNIYRILQESINNAIKYSNATSILVDVYKEQDTFQIQIKDNGNGFDVEKTVFGNGLKNLKKRAIEINGEIKISSEINIGSTISLFFKK